MENRRDSWRKSLRRNIRYGRTYPPQYIAFLTDFSETGLCVKTNRVFAPGTELCLLINTDEGQFKAEGIVAWAKKAPPNLVRHMKSGMGIKFTRVDEGFIELYRKKI